MKVPPDEGDLRDSVADEGGDGESINGNDENENNIRGWFIMNSMLNGASRQRNEKQPESWLCNDLVGHRFND